MSPDEPRTSPAASRPEQLLSDDDLRAMERLAGAGLAREDAVLTLRPSGGDGLPLLVSGGLNTFVGALERWRPDWESRRPDLEQLGISDGFFGDLSRCRGRVDVLGVAEGEICFAGAPLLELHGTLLDVLVLRPMSRALLLSGSAAATGAALRRVALPSVPELDVEISLTQGELGGDLLPPGCVSGQGAQHSYRLLDLDGYAVCDLVVPRGEAAPEPSRPLLERYADQGRACRPLPDPVRSAALHERASAEVGGLGDLFSGRRRYEVRGL